MRAVLTVFGVWQALIIFKLSYNVALEFKMTNAVCDSYNKTWFLVHKCRLRAVSRNKTTMNFNGTVLHPARDIGLHFQVFQKANGYKPWLVNQTVDVCRFLKKPYNPLAKIVGKLFLEFSNFNHTCPYVGPQIVDGFYLRWNIIPNGMPTGEYLLGMNWLFDKRVQFYTNIYFKVVEDLFKI